MESTINNNMSINTPTEESDVSSTPAAEVHMTDDDLTDFLLDLYEENNSEAPNAPPPPYIFYAPAVPVGECSFAQEELERQDPARIFFPAANQYVQKEIIIDGDRTEESSGHILDSQLLNEVNQASFGLTVPVLGTPPAPPPSPEVSNRKDQLATTSDTNTIEKKSESTICSGESIIVSLMFEPTEIDSDSKAIVTYKCSQKLPQAKGEEPVSCPYMHYKVGDGEPPLKKRKLGETSTETSPKEQEDGKDGKEETEKNE